MVDDPGIQMDRAMKAVIKMHGDCIKLFNDLDAAMEGFESYFGNVVTQQLGSSVNNRKYIADGLIRFYSRAKNETDMLGFNVCFYDLNDPKFVEPLLVVAHIAYQPMSVDPTEKYQRGWDPWYAFLSWNKEKKFHSPIRIERPRKRGTIEHVTVAAAPLFSINSVEAALSLAEMVGKPA